VNRERAPKDRDGRLCISNNAAERTLRCVAVGRHNWTFAGSDEGGRRAAAMYTLIETAKLNDIDPQAWLADVLARLPDHPAKRISEQPRRRAQQSQSSSRSSV
jgi:transposase